jgi:excisionase family DNA binding protein
VITLTVHEFCAVYGIGRSKTYELINSGEIIAKKIGVKTVIDRASAEEWYAGLPTLRPASMRGAA